MQIGLIQRYLGNKSTISDEIINAIGELASPGDLIVDAFSGSLAVSASLRRAGYRVACNDINHFSWVFAHAFFSGNHPYAPNGRVVSSTERRKLWQSLATELIAPYDGKFPQLERRTDIFDHYCEEGEKSGFQSSRGTTGRRRFFSTDNAKAIDRALSRIRHWFRTESIDQRTRCILTAMLLSAVEKVSNTQGTYHDFPRDLIDSRALNFISLEVPPDEIFSGLKSTHIGKEQDSMDFVCTIPRHRVLYLDPPYNFRQYTSYYFMLNLLSSHAEVDDLDNFFARIEFVRGQNMESDFKSTFCSKTGFMPSLKRLIERSKADHVVLSYFDGRNHWGQFKTAESELLGKEVLEAFFRSDLFQPNSVKFQPVSRTNYQSYGGHKAKEVKEFLFSASKASIAAKAGDDRSEQWIGMMSG
ncbi:DNA adenine methylase [Puniceibacterium sp. IMCC21224]|uniref:DNA adenine methylase n=1 Tax=Puniceibacterium sp. IMCC21224 TaxID=1618204 RepID=UPI00065CD32E|nr:DNA adenine methylase [Puniceibacterium sp. IMCC21224]KMK66639.1 adenine-specific DNA methylase [Puniceibacterium sp. IMCC21224]